MKKCHRRTYSENITTNKSLFQITQKHQIKQSKLCNSKISFNKIQYSQFTPSSIQSLIQQSSANISQRVLLIQKLQEPMHQINTTLNSLCGADHFSFGKNLNSKLNNFRLSMQSIAQVPKSNQSTSLHGQNKFDHFQKQVYIHKQIPKKQSLKFLNHQKQVIKPSLNSHKRTKTLSILTGKPLINLQRVQKIEKNQVKNTVKNTHLNNGKGNPIKIHKYPLYTHKKNVLSYTGPQSQKTKIKIYKQSNLQLGQNKDMRKKYENNLI